MTRRALVLPALLLAACGDGGGLTVTIPEPTFDAAVVVNSVDNTLSVVPLVEGEGEAFTVGLGPAGSPVGVAAREGVAVVPLGTVSAAAVVDLGDRTVRFTVALPENGGATGVAFLNDTLAVVGNPSVGSVSVVNVRRGTAGTPIPLGGYPHSLVAARDTVWVVNAQLGPDFSPTGPGTVDVLTGSPLARVRTIQLTGSNSGAVALGASSLYVANAGAFSAGNGSLSVVARNGGEEVRATGFGEFPGALAVLPNGNVAVASYAYGVAVWNPATRTFVRAPANGLLPESATSVSALATGPDGTLWVLDAGTCSGPGRAYVLEAASLTVLRSVAVGNCPYGMAFTEVPEN